MTTQSSTPSNGRPMTFVCNLETFLDLFKTPTDAIDHILTAHDDGRVETTQPTITNYTFNRLVNPPRFIAYNDHAPQIHHYEVRINATKCSDNDIVIEFPIFDSGAIDWFSNHLFQRLSDAYGDLESHEINITDPDDLECSALALQRELNLNRIFGIREFITKVDSQYIADAQFEQNCRDFVNLLDENKAITERIKHINDVQYISQLA